MRFVFKTNNDYLLALLNKLLNLLRVGNISVRLCVQCANIAATTKVLVNAITVLLEKFFLCTAEHYNKVIAIVESKRSKSDKARRLSALNLSYDKTSLFSNSLIIRIGTKTQRVFRGAYYIAHAFRNDTIIFEIFAYGSDMITFSTNAPKIGPFCFQVVHFDFAIHWSTLRSQLHSNSHSSAS